VVKLGRRVCTVDTDRGVVDAAISGTQVRRYGVYVGDLVDIDGSADANGLASLVRVHPRARLLRRPAIANLDQMIFVASCKTPALDLETLDKCVFAAEVAGLASVIVVNKIDLLDAEESTAVRDVLATYEKLGYRVILASAETGEGLDAVAGACEGKISTLAGLSGVGKSRMMGQLFPDGTFPIGDISEYTERGMHTTSWASLIRLPHGGYVADTPGFTFVDLPTVPVEEVAVHFREIAPLVGACRFNNCLHDNEPGCVVRDKAESGEISPARYERYLMFRDEMRGRRRSQHR
jgi:ribosome biogenesis GTPase